MLGFFIAHTQGNRGLVCWFTRGCVPCGIVYGKILWETVVQSLISLTLRLGKLTLKWV